MVRRSSISAGVAALASVVMIGNVAMHVNETYRFPGPYVYGSDTRTLTPELLGAAAWFRATQGDGRRVVTDRYTGLAFAAFGRDWIAPASPGFPVWQLYFQSGGPSATLLRQLDILGYRYLIVDRRMAQYLPRIGMYFTPTEPGAFTRTIPPPAAALRRYDTVPWATKIYGSDNLSIYRLNLHAWSIHPAARGGRS